MCGFIFSFFMLPTLWSNHENIIFDRFLTTFDKAQAGLGKISTRWETKIVAIQFRIRHLNVLLIEIPSFLRDFGDLEFLALPGFTILPYEFQDPKHKDYLYDIKNIYKILSD